MGEAIRGRMIRLVSTRAGAERALLIGLIAIRVAGLVQATSGVAMRSLTAGHPPVLSACLVGVAVESAIMIGLLWRRGRPVAGRGLLVVDAATGILLLAVAVVDAAPTDRLMPWSVGMFAITFSTAVLMGLSVRRLSKVLVGSVLMSIFYLLVVAVPIWPHRVPLAAAVTNACAYPKFAFVLWIFARIVRDLADQADRARERAAQAERERGRATVRGMLPYLDPNLLAAADEHTRCAVTQELREKYHQMRAFVDGTTDPTHPGS